ncbi:hypothetical protein H4219_005494 [Mycoemilia scoparia]|uniref:Uncharacterized protein n=1 Tax=Mycoemilia scoparia TaxID=417184 RepID=A0A9W7ZMQ4_9FUNG|nr:hypothetical protein H4219_005494 [Mycoemilia scoparia]
MSATNGGYYYNGEGRQFSPEQVVGYITTIFSTLKVVSLHQDGKKTSEAKLISNIKAQLAKCRDFKTTLEYELDDGQTGNFDLNLYYQSPVSEKSYGAPPRSYTATSSGGAGRGRTKASAFSSKKYRDDSRSPSPPPRSRRQRGRSPPPAAYSFTSTSGMPKRSYSMSGGAGSTRPTFFAKTSSRAASPAYYSSDDSRSPSPPPRPRMPRRHSPPPTSYSFTSGGGAKPKRSYSMSGGTGGARRPSVYASAARPEVRTVSPQRPPRASSPPRGRGRSPPPTSYSFMSSKGGKPMRSSSTYGYTKPDVIYTRASSPLPATVRGKTKKYFREDSRSPSPPPPRLRKSKARIPVTRGRAAGGATIPIVERRPTSYGDGSYGGFSRASTYSPEVDVYTSSGPTITTSIYPSTPYSSGPTRIHTTSSSSGVFVSSSGRVRGYSTSRASKDYDPNSGDYSSTYSFYSKNTFY